MSAVTLSNVTKSFGNQEILHGIDLSIKDGEFVVLVGPSGCGKSTLLRLICGLAKTTTGEIEIAGRSVKDVPSKDRDIAMVFQSYALYPNLSVAKNLAFPLEMRGERKPEIKQKVANVAALLNLEDYLGRLPKHLSGGQRQRVAMGRAIIRDPKVFLFDEPLSNLDANMRVVMRAEIKALHQRLESTIVYVTHDQIEAMTMADTVVVMNDGRIEQVGTPLELFDRPDNQFVAGFLGSPSMNFVECAYAGSGAVLTTDAGDEIDLGRLPNAIDGRCIVGFRPQHIGIAAADGGRGLRARVDVIEPTGAEVHIVLFYGDQKLQVVTRGRPDIHAGDAVTIVIPKEAVHLFDRQSGRRMAM